jgi:hypothetical protein
MDRAIAKQKSWQQAAAAHAEKPIGENKETTNPSSEDPPEAERSNSSIGAQRRHAKKARKKARSCARLGRRRLAFWISCAARFQLIGYPTKLATGNVRGRHGIK